MGHQLAESLPVTKFHRRVVGLLGDGAGMAGAAGVEPGEVDEIADAMLQASIAGLERAKRDEGLVFTFYLLAQVTYAARLEQGFDARLQELGVGDASLSGASGATAADTVYDLVAEFTDAIDQRLLANRSRTDLGEIAIRAATESLTVLCQDRADTLFGTTPDTVRESLRRLSTKKGFAHLSRDFFARLTSGFLMHNLSKELSNHVGPGRRFSDVSEHREFVQNLERHCRTASSVLDEFAGTWYSKHHFEGGITERKAKGWIGHALDKVTAALRRTGGTDGD